MAFLQWLFGGQSEETHGGYRVQFGPPAMKVAAEHRVASSLDDGAAAVLITPLREMPDWQVAVELTLTCIRCGTATPLDLVIEGSGPGARLIPCSECGAEYRLSLHNADGRYFVLGVSVERMRGGNDNPARKQIGLEISAVQHPSERTKKTAGSSRSKDRHAGWEGSAAPLGGAKFECPQLDGKVLLYAFRNATPATQADVKHMVRQTFLKDLIAKGIKVAPYCFSVRNILQKLEATGSSGKSLVAKHGPQMAAVSWALMHAQKALKSAGVITSDKQGITLLKLWESTLAEDEDAMSLYVVSWVAQSEVERLTGRGH